MRILLFSLLIVFSSLPAFSQADEFKVFSTHNIGLSYTKLDRSYIAFEAETDINKIPFRVFSTVGIETSGADNEDVISLFVAVGPSFAISKSLSIFGGLGTITRAKSGDVAGVSDTRGVYVYSQLGTRYFFTEKIGLQLSMTTGGPNGLAVGYSAGFRVAL